MRGSPPPPLDPLRDFGCAFLELMAAHGVVAKAFGTDFNARFFKNWKFMASVGTTRH